MKITTTRCNHLGVLLLITSLTIVGCGPGNLNAAARTGNVEKAREFLANGAEPNQKGDNWNTPLHFATAENHPEVVQILIENGADVNARNQDGFHTPLHFAAVYGRNEIALSLLEAGAYVNAKDINNDLTPLHFAAAKGHAEITRVLIEHGADLDAKSREAQKTPLDVAMAEKNGNVVRILEAALQERSKEAR